MSDILPYDIRKLARMITQYWDIFSNISEGTALILPGVTENDSS